MMAKKEKKAWYKSWWMIVIYIWIGFTIFGILLPDSETESQNSRISTQENEPGQSQSTQPKTSAKLNKLLDTSYSKLRLDPCFTPNKLNYLPTLGLYGLTSEIVDCYVRQAVAKGRTGECFRMKESYSRYSDGSNGWDNWVAVCLREVAKTTNTKEVCGLIPKGTGERDYTMTLDRQDEIREDCLAHFKS